MGQIATTQNLVVIKEVRHAGQLVVYSLCFFSCLFFTVT